MFNVDPNRSSLDSGETKIVFFTKVTKTEVDPITGEETENSFPILKTYCVYNVDQCDGPFDHLRVRGTILGGQYGFRGLQTGRRKPSATWAWIFASAGTTPPTIHPTITFVSTQAPFQGKKTNTTARSSTNRPPDGARKPPQPIAACSIWGPEVCVRGIGCRTRDEFRPLGSGIPQCEDNSTAYLANWLDALNKDSRFIFQAAIVPVEAADYDPELQPSTSRTA